MSSINFNTAPQQNNNQQHTPTHPSDCSVCCTMPYLFNEYNNIVPPIENDRSIQKVVNHKYILRPTSKVLKSQGLLNVGDAKNSRNNIVNQYIEKTHSICQEYNIEFSKLHVEMFDFIKDNPLFLFEADNELKLFLANFLLFIEIAAKKKYISKTENYVKLVYPARKCGTGESAKVAKYFMQLQSSEIDQIVHQKTTHRMLMMKVYIVAYNLLPTIENISTFIEKQKAKIKNMQRDFLELCGKKTCIIEKYRRDLVCEYLLEFGKVFELKDIDFSDQYLKVIKKIAVFSRDEPIEILSDRLTKILVFFQEIPNDNLYYDTSFFISPFRGDKNEILKLETIDQINKDALKYLAKRSDLCKVLKRGNGFPTSEEVNKLMIEEVPMEVFLMVDSIQDAEYIINFELNKKHCQELFKLFMSKEGIFNNENDITLKELYILHEHLSEFQIYIIVQIINNSKLETQGQWEAILRQRQDKYQESSEITQLNNDFVIELKRNKAHCEELFNLLINNPMIIYCEDSKILNKLFNVHSFLSVSQIAEIILIINSNDLILKNIWNEVLAQHEEEIKQLGLLLANQSYRDLDVQAQKNIQSALVDKDTCMDRDTCMDKDICMDIDTMLYLAPDDLFPSDLSEELDVDNLFIDEFLGEFDNTTMD